MIMMEKAKQEPLVLQLLPRKIVKQKLQRIAGGIVDQCHYLGFQGCRGGDSHHITFCSLILPVQKTYGPWEMTVDNCKLNHVEHSTAESVSDVDLFLERINKSSGTWPELEIWQMLFISFSIRITRSTLTSVCRATNMPSLSYIRFISTPQHNVVAQSIGIQVVFLSTRYHTGLLY